MIGRRSVVVAIGDSFSCGVGVGVSVPPEQTWVGLLCAALDMRVDLLASPGLASAEVLRDQVPCAVARPGAVATVFVGLNDVIRSSFDAESTGHNLTRIVAGVSAVHEVVLVVRLHNAVARIPVPGAVRRRYVRRIDEVNAALDRAVAGLSNVVVVDLGAVPALRARCAWAVDRIHLSEYGHHAVAVACLRALRSHGVGAADAAVAATEIPDAAAGKLAELRWFVGHGAPWLASRLPKVMRGRPVLEPIGEPVGVDDRAVELGPVA
jgi:lysophospholipase L1-like esterase